MTTITQTTPGNLAITMTPEAWRATEWVMTLEKMDADAERLASGEIDANMLLAECLSGAEAADIIDGWTEYVGALVRAIEFAEK